MQADIFQSEYQKLNSEQKDAVDTIYWPVMVVAWPGTGKTQIIASRTAQILQKTDIHPENILITTFTEAWVIAIKKRLATFLWPTGYRVKVATFHSFASEMIQDFPEKFIDQRALRVIDDIESFEILGKIVDDGVKNWTIENLFTPSDKNFYLKAIKDTISKLKQEAISPEKFSLLIESQEQVYTQNLLDLENNKRIRDLEKRRAKDSDTYQKHISKLKELQGIYTSYQKEIFEKWMYDFSDMILYVTKKLSEDDELQSHYREKYQFLMIDEFQDTNNAQNAIIDIIAGEETENPNIMVVGDDDQSIYRFQWANIENILNFVEKYPTTHIVVLKENYRSAESILKLSQNVIENNTQRIAKKIPWVEKTLIAKGKYALEEQNHFYQFENDLKEKFFVLKEIQRLQTKQKDATFAIIVKKNSQVLEWSDFFQMQGVWVFSKNNSNILQNHFVWFLLDFFKIIDDIYSDDTALLDIMRSDFSDIENIDVIAITRALYQKNFSRQRFPLWVWDILRDIEQETLLLPTVKNLEKILMWREKMIDLQKILSTSWVRIFVSKVLEELGWYDYIEKNGNFDDLQDTFTLINKIKWYIENNPEITLKQVLNKFHLYKTFGVPILRESLHLNHSSIEILTAHTSKWLEYDYVFIPELYEGNWNQKSRSSLIKLPVWVSGNGLQYADLSEKEQKELQKEIQTEEERRLFFVALTRAKQGLYLSFAGSKENKLQIASPLFLETLVNLTPYDMILTQEEEKQIITSQVIHPLISFEKDEIEYIENFLQNYKLSPTDLNRFIEDPLKFLREVVYRYPFLSNEYLMFGSAYHRALEKASIAKKSGNILPLETIQWYFLEELKRYHLTPDEFERIQKKWLDWLSGYYEIFLSNPREIFALEYNFSSKEVYFEWIHLTGKIDKIEIIWEGDMMQNFAWQWSLFSQNIAIVDYKTGSAKSQWVIKWMDKFWNPKHEVWAWNYFRQLLFYKLMVEHCAELQNTLRVSELALDFVEGKDGKYSYTSVDFSEDEYENFKNELRDAWRKISDIEFWREVLQKWK